MKHDQRYDAAELIAFAEKILLAAGLPNEPARVVAEGLVEADLYGHTTHGLALLGDYVDEIQNGRMEAIGRPAVLSSFAAVETWDAKRLPGIWTTKLAIDAAVERAKQFGLGAIAIRRSHHIACLATFLEAPARDKFLVLLFSSDPSAAHVAPFGGTKPVLTPNPIAAGIPADPDPIILDISTSITTAGLCARVRAEGARLPRPWLMTADGTETDDPNALSSGGSILPVGGLDHGHKGFALSLLVESLTQGLSGFGRADQPTDWGASVMILAIALRAFAGVADFEREVNWLIAACRSSPARLNISPVRIPGEAAFERKKVAMKRGVRLHPSVVGSLQKLGSLQTIDVPRPRFEMDAG
jgi:L-lactate dehydrogenase